VNGERDSIVNGFGGSVVDEKRTSVEGYPGNGSGSPDRTRAANSPSTSSGAACMCCMLLPEGDASAGEFFYILNSFLLLSSRSRSRIMG